MIDHYHEVKNRTEGNPMLTDAQRQWVSTRRKMMSARLGLHHGIAIEPRSLGTVRRVCYTIVSNPYFEGFIYSVIGLNTLLLASKVRGSDGESQKVRIPSLCPRSTRAGIEWCCCRRAVCMARPR